MKFTTEQLHVMCRTAGIPIDATSRVQMPEGASQADYLKTMRTLMDMERDVQVFARFGIGNLVLNMPGIDMGCMKAFCIQEFGEQIGASAMNYQWTARHWQGLPQDVGWGWTWYRRLNRFTPELKCAYIARWKAKKVKYGEMCKELGALSKPAVITPPSQITVGNLEQAADKPDYTCIGSTIYVYSPRQAERFAEECSEQDAISLLSILLSRFPEQDNQDSAEE